MNKRGSKRERRKTVGEIINRIMEKNPFRTKAYELPEWKVPLKIQ